MNPDHDEALFEFPSFYVCPPPSSKSSASSLRPKPIPDSHDLHVLNLNHGLHHVRERKRELVRNRPVSVSVDLENPRPESEGDPKTELDPDDLDLETQGPKEAWFSRLYLHNKHNMFCWVLSLSVWAVFVMALSFGGYFVTRAVNGSFISLDNPDTHTTFPSRKKTIQLASLSISVATGMVACSAFVLSPAFRKFAFPGIMELCWCHMIVDLMRLLQLIFHFSYIYPNYCIYIHFVFQFFQPASILWLAAICMNLLLSMRATIVTSETALNQNLKNWTNIILWIYCIINACSMTVPYMKSKTLDSKLIYVFKPHSSSGLCIGEFGLVYSYIILPLVVLVFALVTTIAFRKKMKALYPEKMSKRIQTRTNLYLLAYMLTWAIVCPGFAIVVKTSFAKTPTVVKIMCFAVYDSQGFLYALITLREFMFYNNRHDETLHLHNVDIDQVDFGDTPVTLGEGTFAVVFQGTWKTKDVAVKVFKVREVDREKMKNEAYLAAKLVHPHLLLTYGCSVVDDDSIAIVTECMAGGTLDDVICSNRLSYTRVLQYTLMIAQGLDFLHSQGVCHRDLKPSNCLLNANWTSIKVSDFGCSRWIVGDSCRVSLTRSYPSTVIGKAKPMLEYTRTMTSNVGTPCWTAPELMTESATTQYSLKVDVYSFAILVWQLYTGKMPFCHINGSVVALEEAVVAGDRPVIPSDCPALLTNLMTYGWDINPDRRPNFSEIVRLLQVELKCLQALSGH